MFNRMAAKRKWLLVAAIVVAVAALCFHAALLRWLAEGLVADDSSDAFQYVAVVESENHDVAGLQSCDIAAEMVANKASVGILLLAAPENRLTETGVLAPFKTRCGAELLARGVSKDAIATIHRDGADDWATARSIHDWLAERPDASVLLLCGRFRSGHLRYVLNLMLEPTLAARVGVYGEYGEDGRDNNEDNWWLTRKGFKGFGIAWLRQLHAWCVGRNHATPRSLNADAYERHFLQAPTADER
jgi:hypothetical protein